MIRLHLALNGSFLGFLIATPALAEGAPDYHSPKSLTHNDFV